MKIRKFRLKKYLVIYKFKSLYKLASPLYSINALKIQDLRY